MAQQGMDFASQNFQRNLLQGNGAAKFLFNLACLEYGARGLRGIRPVLHYFRPHSLRKPSL